MKSVALMIRKFKEKLNLDWLRLQDRIEKRDHSETNMRAYESASPALEAHEKALRDSRRNLHGYIIKTA